MASYGRHEMNAQSFEMRREQQGHRQHGLESIEDRTTVRVQNMHVEQTWTSRNSFRVRNGPGLQHNINNIARVQFQGQQQQQQQSVHVVTTGYTARHAVPMPQAPVTGATENLVPILSTNKYTPVADIVFSPRAISSSPSSLSSITPPSLRPLLFSRIAAVADHNLQYQPSAYVDARTQAISLSRWEDGAVIARLAQERQVPIAENSAQKSPFTTQASPLVHLTVPDASSGSPSDQSLGRSLMGRRNRYSLSHFRELQRRRAMRLMRQSGWYTSEEIERARSARGLTLLAVKRQNSVRERRAFEQVVSYNPEFDLSLPESDPDREREPERVYRGKA